MRSKPWHLIACLGLMAAVLDCATHEAGNCNDNLDNDEDGTTDCADVDCAADPICHITGGTCAAPAVIDDQGIGTTGDTTSTVNQADGSCQTGGGSDVVFTVTPGASLLSLTMTPDAADLGVFVSTDCPGDGTAPVNELGCSDAGAAGATEQLNVTVTPGTPLFIIVGGFNETEAGSFFLDVSSRNVVCGDGFIDGNEQCDDGNTQNGDGCDANCIIKSICGDGFVSAGEECDDGNTQSSDGCSASCVIETNFFCSGDPSLCVNIAAECAAAVPAIAADAGDTTNGSDKFTSLLCFGGTGKENVFSFTPATADLAITVTPVDAAGLYDPVVYAFSPDACVDTNELACADAGFAGDPETLNLAGLTIGVAITIVVDSFSDGHEGAYNLTIQ